MQFTKYPKIDSLIQELREAIEEALGASLVGLYVFGSLVGGDFDADTSDIDLLAIVSDEITEKMLADLTTAHDTLAKRHPRWQDRIEVAYVTVAGMRDFKTKTTRIARISPGEPLHFRDMDIEWLMDWYMVQELGACISGPAPSAFIPKITNREFIASLKNSMNSWTERAQEARSNGYQSYIILTVCRNLYALKFGRQTSKIKGAAWAAGEWPEWSDLIFRAVKWHGSSDKTDSLDSQAETVEFVKFVISLATA